MQPSTFVVEKTAADHQAFLTDYARHSWAGTFYRWSVWGVPAFIAACALIIGLSGDVKAAISFVVLAGVIMLILPWLQRRQLKQSGFFDRFEVTIDDLAVVARGANSKTEFRWGSFDRITHDTERLFLWYNPRCAIIVPVRGSGPPTLDQIVAFCRARNGK